MYKACIEGWPVIEEARVHTHARTHTHANKKKEKKDASKSNGKCIQTKIISKRDAKRIRKIRTEKKIRNPKLFPRQDV